MSKSWWMVERYGLYLSSVEQNLWSPHWDKSPVGSCKVPLPLHFDTKEQAETAIQSLTESSDKGNTSAVEHSWLPTPSAEGGASDEYRPLRRKAIHIAAKSAYESLRYTCWRDAVHKEVLSLLPQGQRSNYGLSAHSRLGGAEQPKEICAECGKHIDYFLGNFQQLESAYWFHVDSQPDHFARPSAPAAPAPPVPSPSAEDGICKHCSGKWCRHCDGTPIADDLPPVDITDDDKREASRRHDYDDDRVPTQYLQLLTILVCRERHLRAARASQPAERAEGERDA